MADDTSKSQGTQSEDISKPKSDEPPSFQPATGGSKQSGLPWGFVALSAAGAFLFMNKEKIGSKGGFVYIIGAIVLGILSANMLARK